jgi:hypothetical protein
MAFKIKMKIHIKIENIAPPYIMPFFSVILVFPHTPYSYFWLSSENKDINLRKLHSLQSTQFIHSVEEYSMRLDL